MYSSETFSRIAGREVWLKAENLQRTGAFKVRGAVNRLAFLSEAEREAGVVAASAGNHGQAVAWAARQAGVQARIFVPQDAPMAKVEACRTYGSELILEGERFEDAMAAQWPTWRSAARPSSTRSRIRRSSPARERSGSSSRSRWRTPRRSSSRSAAEGWHGDRDRPPRPQARPPDRGRPGRPSGFTIADGVS